MIANHLIELAQMLMSIGAVLTRESNHSLVITRPNGERGFKLQLHEKSPDAPLSPYFFNLRTADNPKPGPLTPEAVTAVAGCMVKLATDKDLHYRYVVGVPNAGDPFTKAFSKITCGEVPCLQLVKGEKDGKRDISTLIGMIPTKGATVLVLDDLITAAGSKLMAIRALESYGLDVQDVLVLIDREQGGREELEKYGLALHSVFTMTELFDLYAETGAISQELHAAIMAYQAANR